ncbi:RNA polymerase sigma-70 factor [Pedobacter sp. HDW13]|uniref:RNA polymerase sigma factor n=1 Tax=Pedobacter sp. HDW13 TaxID=2714940 RepID=UPI00140D45C6|nr:RNA polymerase sigma-70 factor [Pedobacter sp. HDW13]QIL41649.1 RNA polymerase sigma-70 factor [Pedobacter sp. HDW13]
MKSQSDIVLIELLKCDSMPAFDELYCRYWEMLYDIAYKKLKDKDDAKDLVHDLFLQLWNSRASLNVYRSFSGFLFVSLKNKIIDKQRLTANRLNKNTDIASETVTHQNTVYDQVYYNELNSFLNHQIDLLPEKMKEIYRLSREENLSLEEIANRLSISTQTVKNQLTTAVKRLRQKISQYLSVILF